MVRHIKNDWMSLIKCKGKFIENTKNKGVLHVECYHARVECFFNSESLMYLHILSNWWLFINNNNKK